MAHPIDELKRILGPVLDNHMVPNSMKSHKIKELLDKGARFDAAVLQAKKDGMIAAAAMVNLKCTEISHWVQITEDEAIIVESVVSVFLVEEIRKAAKELG